MMYFEEALRILLANKVRSLLTITGLIIGVGAVIAIQVLGKSMAGAVGGALGDLSDNTFFLSPNATQANYVRAMVTRSDLAALVNVPNVTAAIPITGANDLVQLGHRQARYYIGGDAEQPLNNGPLQFGRRITAEDIASGSNVCVITDKAYRKLFADERDPIGQSIYVGPHRYVVIGVLAPPRAGLLPSLFRADVYVPYTTVLRQYVHGDRMPAARLTVRNSQELSSTEVAVINKMRVLHGNARLEYNTFDKAQLTKGINGIFGVMTIAVAFIGAVSLLVAGIGIMNIMLVSVTERTREIGVRKAIGARRTQILAQFFIEALLLCGLGCGVGMAVGLGIGAAVNSLAIVKLTGYVSPLPWLQSVFITLGFTVVVTLAFGAYPAYRAAALDPITALRYE
jgi:ABC-type antimicrobial peptide transport system permease subunit